MSRPKTDGSRRREWRRVARRGGVPGRLFSQLAVGSAIAAAFWRAVANPNEGFNAVAFWLLLFIAAALAERSDRLVRQGSR